MSKKNFEVELNLEGKPHIEGVVKRFINFRSNLIEPRHLDIWFPPSYKKAFDQHYPVLYMHDGQVLFEPEHGFVEEEWGVDEMMTRLIGEKKVKETIVVGIWNTEKRFREYQPNYPFKSLKQQEENLRKLLDETYQGGPLGDEYLKFVVEELKPFIDQTFRTLPEMENTFMMGSSMGGIISLYAIARYPKVFKSVACLSTHYPLLLENNAEIPPILIRYFKSHLPKPGKHKIYFDFGTETHDAWYEPYQCQMDCVMEKFGYIKGDDWITYKFEGEEHSEVAWRKRLNIPLNFLLGDY